MLRIWISNCVKMLSKISNHISPQAEWGGKKQPSPKQRYGENSKSRAVLNKRYFHQPKSSCSGPLGTALCLKSLHWPPRLIRESSDPQCDSQSPSLPLQPHFQPVPSPTQPALQSISPHIQYSTAFNMLFPLPGKSSSPSAWRTHVIVGSPARTHQAELTTTFSMVP